jgi:hypothetical protein
VGAERHQDTTGPRSITSAISPSARWQLVEDTPAKPLLSVSRVELFVQRIQFQNPGNFGDRFWMRESAVPCRNREF